MVKKKKLKKGHRPPKGIHYTMVDERGIRWRMAGSRPVSELADSVLAACGLPLP
jgi:hypothetical protein